MKIVKATPRVPQSRPQVDGETVFYSGKGSVITMSRAIFDGETLPIAHITSVSAGYIAPTYGGVGLAIIIGAGLLFVRDPLASVFGIIFLIGGFVSCFFKRKTYYVSLSTAGGDRRLLEGASAQSVQTIVNAINEAIVARSSLQQAAYFHARGA